MPAKQFLGKTKKNAKNNADRTEIQYTHDHTRHNVMTTIKSTQKQLPLLGFLAKFELVCLSLHKNLPSFCLPLQPSWSQPHHFSQSALILWKTLAYDKHELIVLFLSSYDLLSLIYYLNYVHLTPKTKMRFKFPV